MAAKYEMKHAKNREFYFNLKAPNGEIVLTSETYKTRGGAKNGIKSVKKHGPAAPMTVRSRWPRT